MQDEVRNDAGEVVEVETGELNCSRPFPSMPVAFRNDPDGSRYRAAYFKSSPDIWVRGDFPCLTPRGSSIIFGRSDATLNPGGVRIGTFELYRQVEKLDEVLESLCVGQDGEGDVRVVPFDVLHKGVDLNGGLVEKIRAHTAPRTGQCDCRAGTAAYRVGQDQGTGGPLRYPRTAGRSAPLCWPIRKRWRIFELLRNS